MEPLTPIFSEKPPSLIQEMLKAQSKYNINSNKGNSFNIIVKNLNSFIEITANYQDNKEINQFSKKYSLLNLKEIKFLSICDSIDEIYDELLFEFSKNNSTLLEDTDQIIINIPIIHAKYKEISFILNKRTKTEKEMCQDLYKIISNLQEQINIKDKENNEKINLCNKEINDLRMIIQCFVEDNKILIQKIDNLEKEILELKNDKKELNEIIKSLEEKKNDVANKTINALFDDKFEKIENPWTKELDPIQKSIPYILKEEDYFAQKNTSHFSLIKSKHKFENNKIYKLTYNINFIKSSFRIGFGSFEGASRSSRLKDKNSVGLTNEGLFIQGEKRSDIKLNKDNKEIIFIINLKEINKNFELFIDGKPYGKFNFNLDIMYGIAAFEVGSVKINTYRNIN